MNRATRGELIKRVSLLFGWNEYYSKDVVKSILRELSVLIAENDQVVLNNFGSWRKVVRSAHTGVHPKTQEPIEVPEVVQYSFRMSRNLDLSKDCYIDMAELLDLID